MQNKSESHFKGYLKDVSNDQLLQFYEDLEWTPFPLLIIREYQRRFKATNKEIKDKLEKEKLLAKERRIVLKDLAAKGSELSKTIRNRTTQGISSGYNTAKRFASTSERDILVLEKLGELRKKGIITKKEFEEKKQEILERI